MAVTLPPVVLPLVSRDGRSGPNTATDTGAGHQFLFEYSGPERLYAVTWSFVDPTLDNPFVRVFKSTDAGSTWVLQDGANSPQMGSAIFDVQQTGNSLLVLFQHDTTNLLTFKAFDVSTDTWGVNSTAGPDPSMGTAEDLPGFKFVIVNSGDLWVFYNYSTLNNREGSKYVVFSTGTWGSPTDFNAEALNVRFPFTKLVYDTSADVIHVISLNTPGNTAPTTWSVKHQPITTAGVIGSTTTCGTIGPSRAGAIPVAAPDVGKCTISGNSLIVPTTYFQTIFTAGTNQIQVLVGTPLSAPVWTTNLINTLSLPTHEQDYESTSFVSGGTVYVFWVFLVSQLSTTTDDKLYYCSSTDAGVTWSAPTLHYDAVANPPANVAVVGNYIHAVTAIPLASGAFGVVLAMQVDDLFQTSDCLGFYLVDAAPVPIDFVPPFQDEDVDLRLFKKPWIEDPDNQFPWGALLSSTLVLSCNNPCEAVVGVPYNHAFLAITGTPPYTYSIVGGALPDGLNLNQSTGIASGLPSAAGTFPFVLSVIDALLATTTVSCSIDVTDHVCPWQLCALFTTSPSCAMDGTVGLRRTADGVIGSSDAVSSNPITVVAGQIYFIEFFLRGSGGADGTVSVGYDFYDSTNTYLSSAYVTSTGSPTVFTSFTGIVTVPANAVTAVPVIVANNHLTGIWCIAALYSVLMDEYFILSSIRSYFTDYTAYR